MSFEDFKNYGLKANSFLIERQDLPMVNREENLDTIRAIIREYVQENASAIMVIFGDYGMGKSFTLQNLLKRFKDNEEWVGQGSHLYPIFLKSMEPEQKGAYLVNLYRQIMKSIMESGIKQLVGSVKDPAINKLFEIIQMAAQGDQAANDWLIGRNISAKDKERLRVVFKVTDYNEVPDLIFELLEIIKASGFQSLVLLIDEWEFLMSIVSKPKLFAVVRELQRLYDTFGEKSQDWRDKHASLITIIASSEGAWLKFMDVTQEEASRSGGGSTIITFLRRINTKGRVELAPLTSNHIAELLTTRMLPDRLYGYENKGIWPFTSDYTDLMERVTHGIPSRVLSYSSLVLSEGRKRGKLEIDAPFAEEILKEYGVWSEMTPMPSRKG